MYRECKSYSDQSHCVADLAEACIQLKNKLGYSDPDARTVTLNNLVGIAQAGQMILNLIEKEIVKIGEVEYRFYDGKCVTCAG